MTHQLDASAILAHLNELGYCFITTTQLKEFIKDLKKLIKYEERNQKEIQKQKIFEKSNKLYLTPTLSSKAKSRRSKGKKREKSSRSETPVKLKKICTQCSNSETKLSSKPTPETNENSAKCTRHDCGHKIIHHPCRQSSAKNTLSKSSKSTFKKSSQPRSSSSVPSNTRLSTDPVELYHRYKKEWDKQKIPGEDSHLELRWSIRQKMI